MLYARRRIEMGEPLTADFMTWLKNDDIREKTLERWRDEDEERRV